MHYCLRVPTLNTIPSEDRRKAEGKHFKKKIILATHLASKITHEEPIFLSQIIVVARVSVH